MSPKITARVAVFFVRNGRLTGREIHKLDAEGGADKKEVIQAFLKQHYPNQTMFPKEILLEEKIEDMDMIETYLSGTAGHRIKLTVPERGDKRAILQLAQKDMLETEALAKDLLRAGTSRDTAAEDALRRIIKRDLGPAPGQNESAPGHSESSSGDCASTPGQGESTPAPSHGESSPGNQPLLRIEAYDVSHTGGEDSVGAMVVFLGAKKSTKDYRRFKIRSSGEDGKSADDYASIQEVLYRRLKRGLAGESGFEILPDVILVDGGKGHVTAAEQVVSALWQTVKPQEKRDTENRPQCPPQCPPVPGMVKDDRHRTRGLVSSEKEIDLTQIPDLYRLIGAVQEEVHRFAAEYHRGRRSKTMARSELDGINGIGEKRRLALFQKYGSIEKIGEASVGELAQVPGMNRAAAEAVRAWFRLADKK
jgi:excinuclease ABC subunit C